MLTTTFKLLRKHGACKDRYAILRKALKGRKDNEPITLVEILDSNGLDDALWALPAVPNEQTAERDKLARLFACWCVRQVWHMLTDERSRAAVEVSERYAVGEATLDELNAAYAAAAYSAYSAYTAASTASAAAASAASAAAYSAYAAEVAAYAAAAFAAYSAAAATAATAAYDAYSAARDAQAANFREMFG